MIARRWGAADAGHCSRADEPAAHPALDEPSVGLAPKVIEALFGVPHKLKATGPTIALAEQHVPMAFDLAGRAIILNLGRVALSACRPPCGAARRSAASISAAARSPGAPMGTPLVRELRVQKCGLPLGSIPTGKLEFGHCEPASGLAGVERRADRMLAARSP